MNGSNFGVTLMLVALITSGCAKNNATFEGRIPESKSSTLASSSQAPLSLKTATSDFNGDGKSDILWYNNITGQVSAWSGGSSTTNLLAGDSLILPSTGWVIAGVGDFNGDGKSDILWYNNITGQVSAWSGGSSTTNLLAGDSLILPSTGWVIAGVGDFNGDGKSDILWYNNITGQVSAWSGGSSTTNLLAGDPLILPSTGWVIAGIGDFNGDGKSDILWYNKITGQVSAWSAGSSTTNLLPTSDASVLPSTGWIIAGIGDFNGDGKSDILWYNNINGQISAWSAGSSTTNLLSSDGPVLPSTGWSIVGVGDYNGDGKSDILWYNSISGQASAWPTGSSATNLLAGDDLELPSTGWAIATTNPSLFPNSMKTATSDFNGDGKSDILWYNKNTGQLNAWSAGDGTTNLLAADGDVLASTGWKMVGTGDFNGDGKSDILWYNSTTGQVSAWSAGSSATNLLAGDSLILPSTGWVIAGVGDFNGDGKSDILWYNNITGQVSAWSAGSSATNLLAGDSLILPSTGWVIAGVGDFNGDGKSDILWYNSTTGQVSAWSGGSSATTLLAGDSLILPSTGWAIAGVGDFNGDGRSDILWYNSTTGQVSAWSGGSSATTLLASDSLILPSTGWAIAGVGDYNGDGRSDILWYNNTTGQVSTWSGGSSTTNLLSNDVPVLPSTGWGVPSLVPQPPLAPVAPIAPVPPVTPAAGTVLQLKVNSNGTMLLTEEKSGQTIIPSAQQALYFSSSSESILADQSTLISGNTNSTGTYRFSSSAAPGISLDLQVTNLGQALAFKVVNVNAISPASFQIQQAGLRFGMSNSFNQMNCGLTGRSCGNSQISLTSACTAGPCNDQNQLMASNAITPPNYSQPNGTTIYWGVDLYSNMNPSLVGNSFVLFSSNSPSYGSIAHRQGLLNVLSSQMNLPPNYYTSTLFIEGNGKGVPLATSNIMSMVTTAKNLGFGEIMLGDYLWQSSTGFFTPKPGFSSLVSQIEGLQMKVGLHSILTEVDPGNQSYTQCILTDSSGNPVATGGFDLWNYNNSNCANSLSDSYVSGLSGMGITDFYEDGYDLLTNWAGRTTYMSNLVNGFPAAMFETSSGVGGPSPWSRQSVITDIWEVQLSQTPAAWTYNYALPVMLDDLRDGFIGRMGWIPLNGTGGTTSDYQVMLNSAVAVGAPITVETSPDDYPNTPAAILNLYKPALNVLNQLSTARELVVENGDYVQVHYANGATSIGVTGSTTKDMSPTALNGRVQGVTISPSGATFTGDGNPQPSYGGTKLASGGSYINIPPSPATVLQNGLTEETWFNVASGDLNQVNDILGKPSGYSLYISNNTVGGFITPGFSGNAVILSAGTFQPSQWNHLAYTYDPAANKASVYLNGNLMNTGSVPSGYVRQNFESPIAIGGFKGQLANIRLYNRALSAAEIKSEAAFQNSIPTSGLVANWPLTSAAAVTTSAIQIQDVGPVFVSPLAQGISRNLQLTFTNRTPGATCTVSVDGQSKPGTYTVNGSGQMVFTYPMDGTLTIHEITVQGCAFN